MQSGSFSTEPQARGARLDRCADSPRRPSARIQSSAGSGIRPASTAGDRRAFGFAAQRLQIEAHDAVTEQEVVQREIAEPTGSSSSGRVASEKLST